METFELTIFWPEESQVLFHTDHIYTYKISWITKIFRGFLKLPIEMEKPLVKRTLTNRKATREFCILQLFRWLKFWPRVVLVWNYLQRIEKYCEQEVHSSHQSGKGKTFYSQISPQFRLSYKARYFSNHTRRAVQKLILWSGTALLWRGPSPTRIFKSLEALYGSENGHVRVREREGGPDDEHITSLKWKFS